MTRIVTPAFPPTPDRSEASTPTSTTSKLTQNALSKHAPAPSPASSPTPSPLLASNLTVTRTTTPQPVPSPDSPQIWSQTIHTDHMLTCSWSATSGWSNPTIIPFAPLKLSPLSSVLHYSTTCFEGMKAYRGHDGKLRLFRPGRNCARMLKSARRIALPGFEPAELRGLIERFVAVEGPRWLPDDGPGGEKGWRGGHLYLRPTMVGTGSALGVQCPTEALLFVVAVCFPPLDEPRHASVPKISVLQSLPSLAGGDPAATTTTATPAEQNKEDSHDKAAANGMRLLASRHDAIRAWPGGFGNAKVGANYGPSLVAQQEAREKGYNQILWLFGEEGYITEAGASNFFVVWRTREEEESGNGRGRGQGKGRLQLVTAPLGDGVILEGVTRASVLELARERLGCPSGSGDAEAGEEEAVEVLERKFTMAEVVDAADEGRLVEAFACGTAFFIGPVEEIHFRGRDVELPLKKLGCGRGGGYGGAGGAGKEAVSYAIRIKAWLREIMFGRVDHAWGVVVREEEE